jgi:virulence plasmid B protein/VCBS repeat protein
METRCGLQRVQGVVQTPAGRVLLLLVIVGLLLPPPGIIAAQEADMETSAEAGAAESPLSPTPSSGNSKGEGGFEPEASAASAGSSQTEAGAVFISNEAVHSTIPHVDTQTGSLKHSYEFIVPPGRNGMTPQLSLEYDSNAADNTSIVGYGWSLSIPYIKRVNKYGTDRLYASSTSVFFSALDGELVRVGTTSEYRPRVDNGAFRRYVLDSNAWTVLEKDGGQLFFGTATSSRRDDPADSSRIFSWHLAKVRDANDNYISYSYYKEAGQIYPSLITYTENATTDGIFSASFTREARSDNLVSNETGFTATTTYRIKQIETSVSGSWASRYDLGYATGHNGNRSLLASVTRTGRDESGNTIALPATNFSYETYGSSDKKWIEDESWEVPVNIVRDRAGYDDGARFVDINGDSLVDIIQSNNTSFYPGNQPPAYQAVYINTGEAWELSDDWDIPSPYNGRFGFSGGFIYPNGPGTMDLGARFADVNKDGFTDILWSYSVDNCYPPNLCYDYTIRDVYINNGVNGWATSSAWTLPSDIEFMHEGRDAGGRVVDVNGDGLPDLLSSMQGTSSKAYLNTGSGWQAAATSTWIVPQPFANPGTYFGAGTEIADVNGDGLPDIVRANDDGQTPALSVNRVYFNTGSG